jgi:hypothetical protein
MSTLPPPAVDKFADSTMEKKVYNIVEEMKEYLPIANDRNRLAFSLYKYLKGEGDHPDILVKSTKIQIERISPEELSKKITTEIEKIKK